MLGMLDTPIHLLFLIACLFSNPEKAMNEIKVMEEDLLITTIFITHETASVSDEAGDDSDSENDIYDYYAYETPSLTQKLFKINYDNGVYHIDIMGDKTDYKADELHLPKAGPGGQPVTQNIYGFDITFINKSGQRQIRPVGSPMWLNMK